MTLLETVVAFVLLSVVGVACLDLSRGATALETQSMEWSHAVARAEAALTMASAGARESGDADGTQTVRRPWGDPSLGVDEITVTVPVEGGRSFQMSRLVRGTASMAAR